MPLPNIEPYLVFAYSLVAESQKLYHYAAKTSLMTRSFRKENTKGKNKAREIAINPTLQGYLANADLPISGYLFPSKNNSSKSMGSQSADEMLNKYCDMLGIQGASTHSFRRTALTMMCNAGIPLSVIQNISGHASLDMLSRYLGVSPEQKKGAIAAITF